MNNVKKTNLFYLILVVVYLIVSVLLSLLTSKNVTVGLVASLILSEMLFLVPAMIFLLAGHKDLSQWVPFRKVKWSTAGLAILFSFCITPLASWLNIVSLLFTTNAVTEIAGDILALPAFFSVLLIGVFGPFCEEFVFRGVIFSGLKSDGGTFWAILISGLFFGLAHMNLNQFMYAFMLGIAFSLLCEATGSIIPSLIVHALINSGNVLMEYAIEFVYNILGNNYEALLTEAVDSGVAKEQILIMCGTLIVPAAIGTFLSVVIFRAICSAEDSWEHMKEVFSGAKKNALSVSGIIAITICVFLIFFFDKIFK